MNVLDAAHLIAHDCEGGAEALAMRLGVGYKVFCGKVDPRDKGHLLGLQEAVRMQQLSGRCDVLYAMADMLGHVCIPKPETSSSGSDVSTLLANTCAEFGDYLRETDKAMHDRVVTPNEVKVLQKELIELVCAATRLHSRMAAMAEARNA